MMPHVRPAWFSPLLAAAVLFGACAEDRFEDTPPPPIVMGDENDDAQCSDGASNDGDELIDCQDPDCNQNPNVTVCANYAAGQTTAVTSSSATTSGSGGAGTGGAGGN